MMKKPTQGQSSRGSESSPPPSQDIVVQESVGASVPVGGLWDPTWMPLPSLRRPC